MPQPKLPSVTCEELHFLKCLTGALECQQAFLGNKKQTSFSDPEFSFLDGIAFAPSETSVDADSFVQECETVKLEISVMELPHALMPYNSRIPVVNSMIHTVGSASSMGSRLSSGVAGAFSVQTVQCTEKCLPCMYKLYKKCQL
ncbi:uncharacterized protein [Apostichopus japonicus]|uniref:uncharacterized protein n=1 Tax=Stichopus japonicus TaxID=307972 RepID=UPI003AB37FE2